MRVEYHPLTVSELNNAVVYYNQQRAGLGDELRTEFRIVSEDAVRVLVIRHHRRHPSFGLGRR